MKLFVLLSREQMEALNNAPWGIGISLLDSYTSSWQGFERVAMRGDGKRCYLRMQEKAA